MLFRSHEISLVVSNFRDKLIKFLISVGDMRQVEELPMSGSFSDVGGILSPITIKKTVIESSVVMPSVTFSVNVKEF